MNNLIKSILKTAVYFLDQTEAFAGDVRDRFSDTVDRAGDRVSDLRDQASELYEGEDHTMRNVLTFAAGVALGVGAGMLLAPSSGEDLRGSINDKVQDISGRVKDRFTTATGQTRRSATGTEGI